MQKQPETVLQKFVDFDVKGQLEMDFFTGGSIIMDYGLFSLLARSDGLKLLRINNGWFLTNKQFFTSQAVNWWTGEVWITVMFLSAVWTLILTAPIHCRGSTGEQVM